MLKAIFTLDYEIHGNGEGCPLALMVEPTSRMMDLFERYDATLTIMADVAEILKFKEHKEQSGSDDFHYDAIADQFREALRRGHDVQLHLHASYFNARHREGRWVQDWSEYNFAKLPFERMDEIVRTGKQYLEDLLRPVSPAYRCTTFRAANWAVSPSRNVVRALLNNNIRIESSIFKYGRRDGIVGFDYSHAPSELVPWRADADDICRQNEMSELVEAPIYCERRWIGTFLSVNRLYRAYLSRKHRLKETTGGPAGANEPVRGTSRRGVDRFAPLFRRHAWKADFNQCSGRQLIRALERAEAKHSGGTADLPFVLIGHSKLFTRHNERSLRPFLAFVAQNRGRFGFARFTDLPCLSEQPIIAGIGQDGSSRGSVPSGEGDGGSVPRRLSDQ